MAPASKKNPTNADLMAELKDMGRQVDILWNDKLVRDAGVAAIDEYRKREVNDNKGKIYASLKDMMPWIAFALCGVALIIYAYASRTK